MPSHRWSLALWLALGLTACGDSPSGPRDDQYPDPGPGPHYTVVPIDLDKLARVTPIGTNGKVLPIGHTYWYTCDTEFLMPVDRPCLRERLPIRSPVDGTVFNVVHTPNGDLTIEGPPGLYAAFGHVTPRADLKRGDAVKAGDTIAVMFHDHAFDLGMANYGIEEHHFINQARFVDSPAYLHAQSPIAQYAEPLRSELLDRVSTMSDPYGRIEFDVPGTAAGGWFRIGIPFAESLTPAYADAQLFLGPLQERDDIRIVSKEGWFRALLDIAVVDPDGPRWEELTPASGRLWIPLWEVARDGGPDHDNPKGGVLIEVLPDEQLRIEWFDSHQEPADFTSAAEVYER